jgi:hypothetical protein
MVDGDALPRLGRVRPRGAHQVDLDPVASGVQGGAEAFVFEGFIGA